MEVGYLSILPFIALLLSIAILPFAVPKWWNKYYHFVSLLTALTIIIYYIIIQRAGDILQSSEDYIMFISFLVSLYIISGGIFIDIKGLSTPLRNVFLLLTGALISNIIGTTAASMLLIRPYLRTNQKRISSYHLVFFIFLVSNIGGALTPIGNPPLFIGYLKAIPFFWISSKMILPWTITIILVLVIFFIIDNFSFKKQSQLVIEEEVRAHEKVEIKGLMNILLLMIVVLSVFIRRPIFLREMIMMITAIISYKITSKELRKKNDFNFEPMKEVTSLFMGIFITLTPILNILSEHAKDLNLTTPGDLYWMSGLLSAFLDNAPTYLTFLTASMGIFGLDVNNVSHVLSFISQHEEFVRSISIGSVFFGAASYIGNAPNFMVKSVAESQGIKTVSFFGYIFKFSIPILLPIFLLIWILFIN
jgi:Na+/H+ antiporter NhaD/arsenite permease-like protein